LSVSCFPFWLSLHWITYWKRPLDIEKSLCRLFLSAVSSVVNHILRFYLSMHFSLIFTLYLFSVFISFSLRFFHSPPAWHFIQLIWDVVSLIGAARVCVCLYPLETILIMVTVWLYYCRMQSLPWRTLLFGSQIWWVYRGMEMRYHYGSSIRNPREKEI